LAGQNVTVTATVKNQGTSAAGAFSVDIYKHRDAAPSPGLTGDAYCTISGLAAGATTTCVQTVNYAAGGSYKMWAQADTNQQENETNENNNTNYRYLTVQTPMPDLIVSALTTPVTAGAGQTITVFETTKNQGAGAAEASTTKFYLSTNFSWGAEDTYIGQRAVPSLSAGASSGPVDTSVTIPLGATAGSYYIIAKTDADGDNTESNENNNTNNKLINIGPDLVVSALATPSSAVRGSTITVTDSTKNQGGGDALASTTKLYISANSTWDAGDIYLGERAAPALIAGASNTGSINVTIPEGISTGIYSIIAMSDADGFVAETSEVNNNRVKYVTINP
jgi:subtilase family serine protease